MPANLQSDSLAKDFLSGIDPSARDRVEGMFDLAIKEANAAGLTIPEGSQAKGAMGRNSMSALLEDLSPFQKDVKPATKKRMMKNPDVSFAAAALTAPIIASQWSIESTDPDVQALDEAMLKPLWTQLIAASADAVVNGSQTFEKIYDVRDLVVRSGIEGKETTTVRNAVVYKELFDIDPEHVKIVKEKGELVGIKVGKVFLDINLDGDTFDKAAVVTMPRVRWGDYTGEGRLEKAYGPWFAKTNVEQFMLRYLERMGDPPLIGRAPPGTSPMNGKDVPNLDIIMALGKNLRGHGIVALTHAIDDISEEQMWDMSFLEDSPRTASWLEVLEYLSFQIFRAFLQPEKRLAEGGSVGSFASLKIQGALAEVITENLQQVIFEQLSNQLLPIINLANFGPGHAEARIVPGALAQASLEVLQTVLQAIIEFEKVSMPERPITEMMDRVALLDAVKVPRRMEDDEEQRTRVRETVEEDEDEDQNLSIKLASTASTRAAARRKVNAAAKDWKESVADPILKDQIDVVVRQVQTALRKPTEAAQMKALKKIKISSSKHRVALLEFLTEMHQIGRETAAGELGLPVVEDINADDKRTFTALAAALADDRVARLGTVVSVAAVQAIQQKLRPEDAATAIRDRANKKFRDQSNLVTGRAEAWRGFHSGKRSASFVSAPEDDPIVAMRFKCPGATCEICVALDGQVIPVSHREFFAWLPPNHHNDTCDVEYLRQSEVEGKEFPKFKRPPQSAIDAADEFFVAKDVL